MENKKMTKVSVGLDIGIASCGWAIAKQDDLDLILHGVRLFPTVDDPKDSKLLNETRREKRGARRRYNRKKTLKRDFIKFLYENNLIKQEIYQEIWDEKDKSKTINNFAKIFLLGKDGEVPEILEIRKKGLTHKLNDGGLIKVLYWYLANKGYNYNIIQTEDEKKSNPEQETFEYDKNKFPVENQIKFYQIYKYYRGYINREISHDQYKKELEEILKNQNKETKFYQRYMSLFNRQRSFEEGPGSETSKSIYGRWYDRVNHKFVDKPFENMWQCTIGKCSLYPNEYRAPKNSFSSEIFNLLNDLNNTSILLGDDKKTNLSEHQKWNIIHKIAFKYKNAAKKIIEYIKEEFKLEDADIKPIEGYRVNKKNEPEFTTLTSFHDFKNKLENFELLTKTLFIDKKINPSNILDQIVNILSKTKDIKIRIAELEKINTIKLSKTEINAIALTKNSYSSTHGYSFKALRQLINIMLVEPKNSEEVIDVNKLRNNENLKKQIFKNDYLSDQWLEEMIMAPTVKRSIRQTIKVFNEIIKFCQKNDYLIDDVVIEMAREKNNKEKREQIKNIQKFNEAIWNDIKEKAGKETRPIILNKLWYLEQQCSKDAYTLEYINPDEVKKFPDNFDIDHIIPRSYSFSDARTNLVLTRKKHNAQKAQNTPWLWSLTKNNFVKLEQEWKKWYLDKSKKSFYSPEKFLNLTNKKDMSKIENQIDFIARNINDTRYATREILNILTQFKLQNNLGNLTPKKPKVINGKQTSIARKIMKLKKDRDIYYHHAEDAFIIIAAKKQFESRNSKITPYNLEFYKRIRALLLDSRDKVLYSRMQIQKNNISLFNETLYKGKLESTDVIKKMVSKKLLEMSKKDAEKYFSSGPNKSQNSLRIKKYDLHLFKELQKIYESNANESYPFKAASKNNKYLEVSYITNNHKKVQRLINKVWIEGNQKNSSRVILAPYNSSQNNQQSFYETLNWIKIQIYKNKKGKYKLIPIDASNHYFKENKLFPKQDILNFQKLQKEIETNSLPIIEVFRGDVLIPSDSNEIYYLSGHSESQDKLEVKPISRYQTNDNQTYFTINTKLINWYIVKTDAIGLKKQKIFKF